MQTATRTILAGALLLLSVFAFAGCSADDVLSALGDTPTNALTAPPAGSGAAGAAGSATVSHTAGVGWIYISMSDYVGCATFGLALPSGPLSTSTSVPLAFTCGVASTMYIDLVQLYDTDPGGGGAYDGTNWTASEGDANYQFVNRSSDGVTPTVGILSASTIAVGTYVTF